MSPEVGVEAGMTLNVPLEPHAQRAPGTVSLQRKESAQGIP